MYKAQANIAQNHFTNLAVLNIKKDNANKLHGVYILWLKAEVYGFEYMV